MSGTWKRSSKLCPQEDGISPSVSAGLQGSSVGGGGKSYREVKKKSLPAANTFTYVIIIIHTHLFTYFVTPSSVVWKLLISNTLTHSFLCFLSRACVLIASGYIRARTGRYMKNGDTFLVIQIITMSIKKSADHTCNLT